MHTYIHAYLLTYIHILFQVGTVNLYNIYVGDFSSQISTNMTMDIVDALAANIGGSTWYEMMTTYYQKNADGNLTYASNSVAFKQRGHLHESDGLAVYNETRLIQDIIGGYASLT